MIFHLEEKNCFKYMNARIDDNRKKTAIAVDTNNVPARLLVDATTGRLSVIITVVNDPGSTTLNTDKIDDNRTHLAQGVTDDASITPTPLHIDNRNGLVFCDVLVE